MRKESSCQLPRYRASSRQTSYLTIPVEAAIMLASSHWWNCQIGSSDPFQSGNVTLTGAASSHDTWDVSWEFKTGYILFLQAVSMPLLSYVGAFDLLNTRVIISVRISSLSARLSGKVPTRIA